MARKKQEEQISEDFNEVLQEYEGISEDFDIEEEYKPAPLIPLGYYNGNVTEVKLNSESQSIDWTVVLDENGGLMSDGETSIDGSSLIFRNWLPKPGDEDELTKKGNMSKRQAKINMLKDFATGMSIDMSTPKIIMESIQNSDWVGLSVKVKVSVREYEGRHNNSIDRMTIA